MTQPAGLLTRALRRLFARRLKDLRTEAEMAEMVDWLVQQAGDVEGRLQHRLCPSFDPAAPPAPTYWGHPRLEPLAEKAGRPLPDNPTQALRKLVELRAQRTRDIDEVLALYEWLAGMLVAVESRHRQIEQERPKKAPPLPVSYDGQEQLQPSVLREPAPWWSIEIDPIPIPGMVIEEERQYYQYIGRFYSGEGELVELGPWLGCSTYFIMKGLRDNPHFEGRRLHVFDDFVWRSNWMDDHYVEDDRPGHHESFQHLFERFAADYLDRLDVRACKLVDHDGNEYLPPVTWDGGPIEICYIDIGRDLEVNEAWYRVFAKHFIPNKTLVILQDWQVFKELPPRYYNQTKWFTETHWKSLHLVHELAYGALAAFLFKGLPAPE